VNTGGAGTSAGGSGVAVGGSTFGAGGSGVAAGGSAFGAGGSGVAAGGSAFGAGGSPVGAGGALFGAGGAAPSGGATGSGGVDQGTGGSSETEGEIYYEANCEKCHGPTGDGVVDRGPDIKHPVEDYSEVIIRNGRVAHELYDDDMDPSSAEELPDDVLAEIFDYLASQPQPTDGQGLFEDYCLACHGVDAKGGTTTRSLEMNLNDVAELVRNGHDGEFEDRREYMPSWTAEQLTDAEVELISQYVKSLFGQ
jgi:mono/diheme cytochrome c family protein